MTTIASCGCEVDTGEDLYTIHQIYSECGPEGFTDGVLTGQYCWRCCVKSIMNGSGYFTEEEAWNALKE